MKKKVIVIVLIILLVVAVVVLRLTYSNNHTAIDKNGKQIEKNDGSISIPGYEGLTLKANTKVQDIALNNPSQNNCYFRITLMLDDGTVIWQSKLLKPGKQETIVLEKPLSSGTYPNSKLKYECFKRDFKKTPLNGAETVLTLRVK